MTITQGTVRQVITAAGFGAPPPTTVPAKIVAAVEDCGFFASKPLWAATLIGGLFVWVLAFTRILTVYGRFFKLYMYAAITPILLFSLAYIEKRQKGEAACPDSGRVSLSCPEKIEHCSQNCNT